MHLEARVSSLLSSGRSGMLNAQRKVEQMDSFGVPQREIMIKPKSGAFVQPKVSATNKTHSFTVCMYFM